MPTPPSDPYLQSAPSSTSIIRWAGRAAAVWGVGYLGYRIAFTLDGVDPAAAAALLLAETLALVIFLLRWSSAANDPADVVDVPDVPTPTVTVVVDGHEAAVDELRTTLVSCRRLRGVDRIVVAVPGGSPWLRPVTERFGAVTDERPAISVVADTNAMWTLLLRAGDVPMPDALEVVAAVCSAPDVGVVQLGIEEADPSSYEHDPSGRWSLAPFEHQVVRPSLAARGSIPWYGDVPALVRPVAVREAVTPTASTVALGLHALRSGFRVTMVPRTLARVRGPQSLAESVRARFERSAPLRRAALTRLAGVPGPARRAHRVALADPLAAVQRMLLVATAVLALGFGALPLDAPLVDLAVMVIPAYLLRWNAQLLLGRGRLGPFSVARSELRSIGVDLAFGFGRGERHARQRFGLLGLSVVVLDVAVFVAVLAVMRGVEHGLSSGATAIALVLTGGFLAVAAEVLLDAFMRRQRRLNHRVRLGLVTCRLGGHDAQLHDLSTGGCGAVVAAMPDELPVPGTVVDISFRIPDATGEWRDVVTAAEVAHVAPEAPGETRLGLAFTDPTGAPLDPVIEFLTIDRRLVTLGRRPSPSVGEEIA